MAAPEIQSVERKGTFGLVTSPGHAGDPVPHDKVVPFLKGFDAAAGPSEM